MSAFRRRFFELPLLVRIILIISGLHLAAQLLEAVLPFYIPGLELEFVFDALFVFSALVFVNNPGMGSWKIFLTMIFSLFLAVIVSLIIAFHGMNREYFHQVQGDQMIICREQGDCHLIDGYRIVETFPICSVRDDPTTYIYRGIYNVEGTFNECINDLGWCPDLPARTTE